MPTAPRTFTIKLGTAGNRQVTLDARRLLDTRLLVTGNSGAGKSWILRLLAEQTCPRIPTIVLDPEGEYASLRELVDVVLVGNDGEVRPSVRNAGVLAHKLLELDVSAVVDLSSLKLSDRRAFVRGFIESLMATPKTSWRPLILLIDEAHRFCPERGSGEAESTDAVITLLSQGRKRGFCTVLATQRLSKLHKDAAAEAVNALVGRTTLDADVTRARDLLGLGKREQNSLRNLKSGTWYAFGPAFDTDDVTQFVADSVRTTHPEAGSRHLLRAPEPSKRIRKVLHEFADLPQEAERDAPDLSTAKRRIAELEQQLAKRAPDASALEAAVAKATGEAERRQRRQLAELEQRLTRALEALQKVETTAALARQATAPSKTSSEATRTAPEKPGRSPAATSSRAARSTPTADSTAKPGPPRDAESELGQGGMRRILVALAQVHPKGCERSQLGLLAGLAPSSGTFANYLSKLRSNGWIETKDRRHFATARGLESLGEYEPLPTGRALVQHWLNWLGNGGARRMLEALVDAGAEGLRRDELAAAAGLAPSSGTFANYLSQLRRLELASGRDIVRVAETLRLS